MLQKSVYSSLYFKYSSFFFKSLFLKKAVKSFYSFLTTHEEAEKYVELIEKTQEAKIIMQPSFSDNCVFVL